MRETVRITACLCSFGILGLFTGRLHAEVPDGSSYFDLASVLSDHPSEPDSLYADLEVMSNVIRGLASKSGDPAVREAAREFEALLFDKAGVSVLDRARAKAKLDHEKAEVDLNATIAAAKRGDFIRTEQREVRRFDPSAPGGSRIESRSVTVDDGPIKVARAEREARKGERDRAVDLMSQTLKELEVLKRLFWTRRVPSMPEKYAGPKSAGPVVAVRFNAAGGPKRPKPGVNRDSLEAASDDGFYGKHVAKNISGRTLNHVTLMVEYVHYTSFPTTTGRHYYYLRNWKPGEAIDLARDFTYESREAADAYVNGLLRVRTSAEAGSENVPVMSPELPGMMGVVRLQTTAWADEMRQPVLATDLPERVDAVGRELIEEAKIASTRPDGWKVPPPRRPSPYVHPLLPGVKAEAEKQHRPAKPAKRMSPVETLVRPVLAFAPKGSGLETEARAFLNGPSSIRKQAKDDLIGIYLAACARGKTYVGSFDRTRVGTGRAGIRFTSADPKATNTKVTAVLFCPNFPEITRSLTGAIAWDPSTSSHQIRLKLGKTKEGKPDGQEQTYIWNVFEQAFLSLTFNVKDGALVGRADNLISRNPASPSTVYLTLISTDPEKPEPPTVREIVSPAEAEARRKAEAEEDSRAEAEAMAEDPRHGMPEFLSKSPRNRQPEAREAMPLPGTAEAALVSISRASMSVQSMDFKNNPERRPHKLAALEALRLAQELLKAGRSPRAHLDTAVKELDALTALGLKNPANVQRLEAARQAIAAARPPAR